MSKNTLYLECYEGITGEMVLGALRELAEDVETEERAHAISRGESNCAVTGLSEEGIKRDTEKRGKEHRTTQEELLTRIDSLLDKLQIEKITASPVWSDKGPTDAAGLAIAARAAGVCPERFTVKKVGMGISYVNLENGDRELRTLRAMLIEETPIGNLWILESNIDDCAGEVLGYTMDLLFEAGARDVWFTPIFMKKNRPAYQLSVLCTEDQIRALDAILFRETTTIGIRRSRMARSILKRKEQAAETSLGPVAVKAVQVPALDADGKMTGETETRLYPEYAGIAALCRSTGRSYQAIWQQVLGELAAAEKKEG